MKGSILRNNEDDYLQKVRSGVLEDRVLSALIMAAEAKGGSAYNGDTTDLNYHGEIKRRADYKKTIDQLTIEIATKGLKNVKKPKDEMSQMMTESRVNENSHQEKGSGMQKKRSSDNRYGFVDYAMFTVFSLLGILVISLLVMMILTFK